MTAVRPVTVEPLPAGFRVALDPSTTEVGPGVWLGGQPMRVLRVTGAGRAAWAELRAGPVSTRAGGVLARRFVDAGLAHPVPPVPPAPAARPDVTVVIPVHDRAADLDRCLTALGRAYPVIVVDDASADAAAVREVAVRHGAQVIRPPHNLGPGGARNLGLAAVRTELVAFLDSDTAPGSGWIEALVAHLADPLVAVAAPRIEPLVGTGWAARFTAARSPLDLGRAPAAVRPYGRVGYVPTAAMVARRAALADGFDPALRYGEDVDLIWRLLDAGWRIRYQPESTVGHREPGSWAELLRRRYRYGTSAAPLAKRHAAKAAPFIVHPWYTGAILAGLAGRPRLTLIAVTGSVVVTRRALRRAGLPARHLPGAVTRGLGQTWLGLGRYATQFAAPALLITTAAAAPRRKMAAASLLLGPAIAGWLGSGRRLDPVRFVVASVADDVAYGSGVLAGCTRQRTLRPLIPRPASRRQRS